MLKSFEQKVEWRNTLEPFVGVHFSNELLDAMPVNLRGELVDLRGDDFVLIDAPVDQVRNQSQLDWIDTVARNLMRGYVLIIDYGFARGEFREMVQTRARHRLLDSPFQQIGHADITAHIDWASIIDRAKQSALRVAGFTDQHHFFTGIISEWPQLAADVDSKTKRELQTLLHPEMLGRIFQVLALAKDVDPDARLAGFKFARDSNDAGT